MFTLDHRTKHAVHATMIKDTKSVTVKKAMDEESKNLSAMAREQIQNTKQQVTRKKLNPLVILSKVRRENDLKVKAASKVQGQQKEQQTNGEDIDKNKEGARAG